MKWPTLSSVLFVVFSAGTASAAEPAPVVLFDGTSLTGWHQAGPGQFDLKDGTATASGGMGLLWNDHPFKNFVADVQYKVAKRDDNSGVFVRFPDPGNDPWVAVNKGHEIQICDTEKGNRTGAIYNFQDSATLASKPVGEWNEMVIKVVGETYTVTLNGKEVNHFVSDRSMSGFIGLQNHGGAVSFRKVTVTPLPDDAAAATADAPAAVADAAPGLVGQYYFDVTNFKQIDRPRREPFFVRVDPAMNFPVVDGDFYGTHLTTDFGVVWTGSIHIDKPGDYLFNMPSDDGSLMTIGSKLVVDNSFRNVPMKDKFGEITFPAAGDYPVRIQFHQAGGGAGIVLSWKGPEATAFEPVPAAAFVHAKSTQTVAYDKADFELAGSDHTAWVRKHGKPYEKMDYGPFLAGTFSAPEPTHEAIVNGKQVTVPNVTDKGIIISLNKDHTTNVIFDTETLRYSAGWTGGYVDYNGVAYNGAHGTIPAISGKQIFGTPVGPGWEVNGSFKDDRKNGYGNIQGLHYRGLYRSGDQTVLSYEINGVGVLDAPQLKVDGDITTIFRTLRIDASKVPMKLVGKAAISNVKSGLSIIFVGAPPADPLVATTSIDEAGTSYVEIKPHDAPLQFTLDIQSAPAEQAATEKKHPGVNVTYYKAELFDDFDFATLTKGGPRLWGDPIPTTGKLGTGDGPYVVDTITPPASTPFDAWFRFSGFDFFPDGKSAAICTWNGDVWIVKGIDEKLDHLTWQRYATGLFQPLGLKIVNGDVYVSGRDQITRLHDTNGDGEADFYENFNNDCQVSSGFHEFQHDLQVDSKGNFYFAKGGPVNPGGRGFQALTEDAGCIMQVSADGKHSDVYATGLRAPNGMSMGPHDEITVSDNQGTWMPACRISFVTKGSYLGVPTTSHRTPEPKDYGDPICWFPYVDGNYSEGDNSSGGAAWDITNKWGPLDNHLIHLSYGTCSIFETMYEDVDGIYQGGVCRFPLDFDSGMMRARFNPVDGQLYLCGLKGWQTRAAKDGAFQRVRYTGKPVNMPDELHAVPGAIVMHFTNPVDGSVAADNDNWSIEQWNYQFTEEYGSEDMSVANPKKKGHDTVDIDSITVSPDKKTVTLNIKDLKPVMQMKIIMKIKAADGAPMNWEVDNTINVIKGMKPIAVKQPGN
jgi:hypothetical protein